MAVHELTLPNLAYLEDGRIVAAFADALKRAAADCEDRPGETKSRTVVLQAELTPIMSGGHLESVDVRFHVQDKVPTRKSKAYNMGWRRGSKLVFNDMSPDNINQKTIDGDSAGDSDDDD